MVDRVRPRKMEYPSVGGTQLDQFPTDMNPNEDFVDVRGVTIQGDSSDDETVIISRRESDGQMTFQDSVVTTPALLQQFLDPGNVNDILTDDVTGQVLVDDVLGNVLVNS